MHDKIANLAVWWRIKILILANFIVSYCNQPQKTKPIMSQNAGHHWARTPILVSPASFIHSAHIEPSKSLRANIHKVAAWSPQQARGLCRKTNILAFYRDFSAHPWKRRFPCRPRAYHHSSSVVADPVDINSASAPVSIIIKVVCFNPLIKHLKLAWHVHTLR